MAAHGKGFQTERVVINVTPEQAAAVDAMLDAMIEFRRQLHEGDPDNWPLLSRNDILLYMLKDFYCNRYSRRADWPEHVKVQGQRSDLKPNP